MLLLLLLGRRGSHHVVGARTRQGGQVGWHHALLAKVCRRTLAVGVESISDAVLALHNGGRYLRHSQREQHWF